MEVVIAKDRKELAEAAAGIIREQILRKPNSVLGLATGYLCRLIENVRVVHHLARYHPELLSEFQRIVQLRNAA